MKKLSNIFFLVGGILGFVAMAGLIIAGVVFFVLSLPVFKDAIIEGINNGTIKTSIDAETVEDVARILQIIFIVLGVVFELIAVLYLISAIYSMKARRVTSTALYITDIVLGVLVANEFALAGAILGLIDQGKKRPKEDEKVVQG